MSNQPSAASRDEILARINAVVCEQLDDDMIALSMNTLASSVEGWDSLAHVRIMIAIEEDLSIRFQTSEIDALKNVGDLVAVIDDRLQSIDSRQR